jgi:hypothetical protein
MAQGRNHVPTDETRRQVLAAVGFGLRHEKIATLLGITDKTLRRKYRHELDHGVAIAHFNVGKTTYEQAVSGKSPTMTIWYEKTRMGMRETVQVATPQGEAIVTAPGEPELIGAYFARLRAAAATSGPAGTDPGADQSLGEGGQEPYRQGRDPPSGEG